MKYHIGWKQANKSKLNIWYILLAVCVVSSLCIFWQIINLNKETERRLFFPNYSHNHQEWINNQFKNAGINPKYAYKIMMCESKGDENATNNNGKYGIDRGLWQINSKYHPEVSNSCAYNYKCSTLETIRIVKKSGWKEWICAQ